MGQKAHPFGLRLKINKTWKSTWYFNKKLYVTILHEDFFIRREIIKFLKDIKFEIANIEIVRNSSQKVTIIIETPRPGVVIGTKGINFEQIGKLLSKNINRKINIKVKEIKKSEHSAQIVCNGIAKQISNRAAYRKVLKTTLHNSVVKGVQGIKIQVSGRLGGAEIARVFKVKEGRVPLHTLRANIDYGFAEAYTTYGIIGVKVWIFRGEILGRFNSTDAGQVINKKFYKEKENLNYKTEDKELIAKS